MDVVINLGNINSSNAIMLKLISDVYISYSKNKLILVKNRFGDNNENTLNKIIKKHKYL